MYLVVNAFVSIITLWFVIGCKQSGVYGTACDIPCLNTCKGNICHIQSGACLDCKHGVYGSYCNLTCPASCKNNTCHMQNGSCLECKPGGYGSYCNQSCSTNCKDKICHMQNGTCLTCESGWTGMYCKTSKNINHLYIQYWKILDYILVFFFLVIIYKLSLIRYFDDRYFAKIYLFLQGTIKLIKSIAKYV